MRPWSIGIVGGGPGGLMVAYRLQQRARSNFVSTIFEATGRLGGKVLTNRFGLAPVAYEAGAAELYDYSVVDEDPLRQLVAELGLSTRPMGGATVVMDNTMVSHADDLADQFGASTRLALEDFDRRARDRQSPREFYLADWREGNADPDAACSFQAVLETIADPSARRYVQSFTHSDLATEPDQTNGSYGIQNYLMNDPAYMRLYCIDGGNERLPAELAQRVDANVLLNHPVVRIEPGTQGRLRVVSSGHPAQEREFDFVVVALPNNLLPNIEWSAGLEVAMRRHHEHYRHPAHYLRVSILFQKPFWRQQISESYFMLDAFGGCCLYDESARLLESDHGVLGWLLGGTAAAELSQLSDDQLISMMLETLPSFLQFGRDLFLEGRVHRWVNGVNGLPAGYPAHNLDARHQPDPIHHPQLFVVGDYLFDSTLNGVLDSADYVADWLTAEMEFRSAHNSRAV